MEEKEEYPEYKKVAKRILNSCGFKNAAEVRRALENQGCHITKTKGE